MCICVDKWKRSHVGKAVDMEYETVIHRRTPIHTVVWGDVEISVTCV